MTKSKDIEVLIKLPDTFLSEEQLKGLGILSRFFRDSIEKIVKEKVVNNILKELKVPKVKIDKKKLQEYVHKRIAEKLIDGEEVDVDDLLEKLK